MHRLAATGLFAMLAPLLPSQDRVSIPRDSLMILEMTGPAGFREAFEGTRLGRMLANPRMGALLSPLALGIEMGIRSLEQETGRDIEYLHERLMGYGGRVLLALTLTSRDPAIFQQDTPPFAGVVVVQPDGETDLDAIADELLELAEDNPDSELQDFRFGDRIYRAVIQDDAGVTLPAMLGDQMVMFVGAPLDDAIALFLDGPDQDRFQPPEAFAAAPLAARFDLGAFISLVVAAARAEASSPAEADMIEDMMDGIGLTSLGITDLMLRTVQDHVVADTVVEMKPGNRGIFEMYVSEGRGPPAAFNLVPRHAPFWTVQPVAFGRAYASVTGALDRVLAAGGMSMEQLESQFEMMAGIRLREDLVAHLDDAVITVMDESYFSSLASDELEGVSYGITIKDPDAIRRTLDTVLARTGLQDAVETDEYRGVPIHTLRMPNVALHYAVTDNLLLLGGGDGSAGMTRSVLDQAQRMKDGEAPGEFPEGVSERLDLGPEGWSLASAMQVTGFVRGMLEMLGAITRLPPQAEQMAQLILGMLKDFQLDDVVMTGGFDGGTLRVRTVW